MLGMSVCLLGSLIKVTDGRQSAYIVTLARSSLTWLASSEGIMCFPGLD